MLHLAHFIQRYPPALGGSEIYFERLTNHLRSLGNDVAVWTTNAIALEELWKPTQFETSISPELRRYAPMKLPFRRYLVKAASLIPIRPWQALMQPCNPICPEMWRDAGRHTAPLDAVHATAFPYSFPLGCGLRLARKRNVPFLLTPFLHLGDPMNAHDRTRLQYTKPHLRWLARQADRVFVQTPSEYRAALELGVRESRVVLQGLGVTAAECTGGNRSAARTSWNVESDDEIVFGHLANLSEEKGSVDLLRACEASMQSKKRFRIVLAGPEMPNFRSFWERFPQRERIVKLGPLTHEQKLNFFAGLDVFVLPSRTDSFGLVLLEAWANGKPNIAYRAGGPADILQHEKDGLLAPCGDVAALARQMQKLLEDAAMQSSLGSQGQLRTQQEFSWHRSLGIVERELKILCEK